MSQWVSAAGFDCLHAKEVLANVEDRLAELRKTRQKTSGKAREEALGDLLFLLVHWALLKGMSAEETLRKANRRLANRFRRLEKERSLRGNASKMIFPERADSL